MQTDTFSENLGKRAWLYGNRYEKFIHVAGRQKFYRPIMHRTHPQRTNRFARRRCKSASQAQAYGLRFSQRYIRMLLWGELAQARDALKAA